MDRDGGASLNPAGDVAAVQGVAGDLVEFYYGSMMRDPASLAHQLYGDKSSYSRIETGAQSSDKDTVLGLAAIREKIIEITPVNTKFVIAAIDAQNSVDGSVLILVTGTMYLASGTSRHFVQTVLLVRIPDEETYYVQNDIIRFLDNIEAPVVVEVAAEPEAAAAPVAAAVEPVVEAPKVEEPVVSEPVPVVAQAEPEPEPAVEQPAAPAAAEKVEEVAAAAAAPAAPAAEAQPSRSGRRKGSSDRRAKGGAYRPKQAAAGEEAKQSPAQPQAQAQAQPQAAKAQAPAAPAQPAPAAAPAKPADNSWAGKLFGATSAPAVAAPAAAAAATPVAAAPAAPAAQKDRRAGAGAGAGSKGTRGGSRAARPAKGDREVKSPNPAADSEAAPAAESSEAGFQTVEKGRRRNQNNPSTARPSPSPAAASAAATTSAPREPRPAAPQPERTPGAVYDYGETVESLASHIMVKGLQPGTSKDQLEAAFKSFGVVTEVLTPPNKTFGFVVFASVESAQNAINARTHQVNGHDITIEQRLPKSMVTQGRPGGAAAAAGRRFRAPASADAPAAEKKSARKP